MEVRGSLGRYRIEREIGRGSMGRVFLAYDPQLDRPVALKVIQALAGLPEGERARARDRFLREARVAARLLHPGVVTVFDVGEAEGMPYLAMEYLEGRTLDAHASPGTLLPVEAVAEIVARAAEALHFAHARGTVHRDVKPSNLMLVGDRTVKILDFGLARGFESGLTHEGQLLGTPSYMSPEQVRGDPVDGRSDLFSLAIVLHELLCGEKPFTGATVSSILYRIVHEDPQEPAVAPDRLGPAFREVLARALAKDPAARFQTGEDFAAAVRAACRAVSPPARPTGAKGARRSAAPAPPAVPPAAAAPVSPSRRRSRSFGLYLLGAGLAAAGLAGGALLLHGQRSREAGAARLEVRVRTEPAGLPVSVGGKPLEGDVVRFSPEGPLPEIVVVDRCRQLRRAVGPEDAGTEIVLVSDATAARATVDPGRDGARVLVNGREVGRAPAEVELDLCADNVVRVEAAGFRAAEARLPSGSTPLEARTKLAGLRLEPVPRGRLVLEAPPYPARLTVDGREARAGAPIEVEEGEHEVRLTNEDLFLDWRVPVRVAGGRTASPRLAFPALATLVVQAYPPNCRAYVRRGGSPWRYLDDTPLSRELAPGRYGLKVEYVPTGASRELEVELRAGENPPVRVSFPGDRS